MCDVGSEKLSCPASFPFSSNCIFPVSPSFIVFCFQEAAYPFVYVFCNVVPHYRHKKTLPCSASVSVETKNFRVAFCSPPVVSDTLLDGVAQDGHSNHHLHL
jgi:hypothetical protein